MQHRSFGSCPPRRVHNEASPAVAGALFFGNRSEWCQLGDPWTVSFAHETRPISSLTILHREYRAALDRAISRSKGPESHVDQYQGATVDDKCSGLLAAASQKPSSAIAASALLTTNRPVLGRRISIRRLEQAAQVESYKA
jgi:hypothetical protein